MFYAKPFPDQKEQKLPKMLLFLRISTMLPYFLVAILQLLRIGHLEQKAKYQTLYIRFLSSPVLFGFGSKIPS